jgi:hypothetical protein
VRVRAGVFMQLLKERFPHLHFGYFNPPRKRTRAGEPSARFVRSDVNRRTRLFPQGGLLTARVFHQ